MSATTLTAPSMTVPAPAHRDWQLWSVDARLAVTDGASLDGAHALLTGITDRVDALASRFRPDSTVRRLALTGADDELIDPLLAALVREALAAARFTDGDVDPTLGRAMQRNGYPVDIAQLRARSAQVWRHGDTPAVTITRREPAWHQVQLKGDRLTMPPGILLDLGATAEALTADWAARAVVQEFGGAGVRWCGTGQPRRGHRHGRQVAPGRLAGCRPPHPRSAHPDARRTGLGQRDGGCPHLRARQHAGHGLGGPRPRSPGGCPPTRRRHGWCTPTGGSTGWENGPPE